MSDHSTNRHYELLEIIDFERVMVVVVDVIVYHTISINT